MVTCYLGFSPLLFLPASPALGTNLGPPDKLVALVLIGLIDLHERVRLAKQILGAEGKGHVSLVGSAGRGG